MRCDSPFYVLPKAGTHKVPVPCGRCPPCKIRRVNSWVFRLMEEKKRSSSAHFVTLTYNTDNVPISQNGFLTLRKKDFQDYMKRLRKLTDNKLKYYAVGEYGSTNHRPHYHAVIFNCPDPEFFHQAWGLGDVHVGQVTDDSVAYTMKYIDKSNFQKRHSRDDRVPEFPLMSKKLGDNFLTDEMHVYFNADPLNRLFLTKLGGYRIALPRYYRLLLFDDETRKRQQRHIEQLVAEGDYKERIQYKYNPSSQWHTFEQHQDQGRLARFQRFYTQQKLRKL